MPETNWYETHNHYPYTSPARRICATCAYWSGEQGTLLGQCRAHAPTTGDEYGGRLWYDTAADDWCGDWVIAARPCVMENDNG